jgi:hypothetical protein
VRGMLGVQVLWAEVIKRDVQDDNRRGVQRVEPRAACPMNRFAEPRRSMRAPA